jgi:O-Antigen ligase
MNGWVIQLGSFGLILFVPISLGLFFFSNLVQKQPSWPLLRPWLWVWLALLLPVPFQIAAGRFPTWLILQFLFTLFASLVLHPRTNLKYGLALALSVVLLSLVFSWQLSKDLWVDPTTTPKLLNLLKGVSVLDNHQSSQYRSISKVWNTTPGAQKLQLSFEARSLLPHPNWEWYRYNLNFKLLPFTDERGEQAVHIIPPTKSEKSRYISRELFTGYPLAGRTFRATLDLRSETPLSTQDCNGVVLQENGGKYRGQCLPVNINQEWQRVQVEWQAPENILTQNIRLVLLNLDIAYDVKNLILEEKNNGIWKSLGALEPAGVVMRPLIENTRRQDLPSFIFIPDAEWKPYNYTLDLVPLDQRIPLVFQVEAGQTLELKNISLGKVDAQTTLKPSAFPRHALWFPQANIAGHSISLLGLALMIHLGSGRLKGLTFFLTLAAIYVTGSRTAFLGTLLGSSWLMLLSLKSKSRKVILFILIILLGIYFIAWSRGLGSIRVLNLEDENSVTRLEIWKVAWQGFLEHPWTGLGEEQEAFVNYWQSNPSAPKQIAAHAHNFWLQFALGYGISGLLASFWISISLYLLAWRWGKWQGFAVITIILFMNIFDYTLFYSSFLSLLLLTINTLYFQYNRLAHN